MSHLNYLQQKRIFPKKKYFPKFFYRRELWKISHNDIFSKMEIYQNVFHNKGHFSKIFFLKEKFLVKWKCIGKLLNFLFYKVPIYIFPKNCLI